MATHPTGNRDDDDGSDDNMAGNVAMLTVATTATDDVDGCDGGDGRQRRQQQTNRLKPTKKKMDEKEERRNCQWATGLAPATATMPACSLRATWLLGFCFHLHHLLYKSQA